MPRTPERPATSLALRHGEALPDDLGEVGRRSARTEQQSPPEETTQIRHTVPESVFTFLLEANKCRRSKSLPVFVLLPSLCALAQSRAENLTAEDALQSQHDSILAEGVKAVNNWIATTRTIIHEEDQLNAEKKKIERGEVVPIFRDTASIDPRRGFWIQQKLQRAKKAQRKPTIAKRLSRMFDLTLDDDEDNNNDQSAGHDERATTTASPAPSSEPSDPDDPEEALPDGAIPFDSPTAAITTTNTPLVPRVSASPSAAAAASTSTAARPGVLSRTLASLSLPHKKPKQASAPAALAERLIPLPRALRNQLAAAAAATAVDVSHCALAVTPEGACFGALSAVTWMEGTRWAGFARGEDEVGDGEVGGVDGGETAGNAVLRRRRRRRETAYLQLVDATSRFLGVGVNKTGGWVVLFVG
ncbi:hypothetical protein MBLNU459_g0716t2 [Dothideomycetes sp. NU459]